MLKPPSSAALLFALRLITHLTHLRFDYERDEHLLSAQRKVRPPEGHTALAYGASVGTM